MITVIVSHPNGQRQEVLLAGVPRVGESIRLRSTEVTEPSLAVDHVLWEEGPNGRDPTVLVLVRARKNEPNL